MPLHKRDQDTEHLWSRREAIGSIVKSAAIAMLPLGPASAQTGKTFTPEMFGATGDGKSDDYDAFQRLARAVNEAGGGMVQFASRKRYLLDRHQVRGDSSPDAVRRIEFTRCAGLTVDLNGSTIEVKGDFHRSGDLREGRASSVNAITPLVFTWCEDLIVRNGSLDGNVGKMTRDPKVGEREGNGISIYGCRRVLLKQLHVHHFSNDGVRLGITNGDEVPCVDVRIENVRLTNNARQGLTNAGASQVVAIDSDFSENGVTGSFRHAPSSGVDIEPIRRHAVKCDFRALRCSFNDNVGYPVVSSSSDKISVVELIDCTATVPTQKRMIMCAESVIVRGGTFHNVQIACAYAAHRRFDTGISIEVSGARWTGDDPRWAPIYDVSRRRPHVHIHDNIFELRSPRPFVPTYLFLCANPNHRFENNKVFVSRTGHAGDGNDLIGNFKGAASVRGNTWSTDARAPLKFVNNYEAVKRVEQETFSGSFVAAGRRSE